MPPRAPPVALANASSEVLSSVADFQSLSSDVSATLRHRTLDYAVDRCVRSP
jgi:hypothetical protein